MIVELLSLAAGFCYTLSGILAVFGMKGSNPISATFISLLVNVAFLWPLALLFSPIVFDGRAVLLFALSAAFAPVTGRLLNFLSLGRVGVSTTTSIMGLQPIIVAVLASIFLSERFPVIVYVAIVITVIGVILIGRSRSNPNGKRNLNMSDLIFPLSATFCYSSSNITRKEGLKIQNLPLLGAAVTSSFSALYLVLYLIGARQKRHLVITRSSSAFFIVSGLVNSVAWITNFQALNLGEAAIVSTIMGMQPLIAIVLGYLLLRKTEVITLSKILGASLIVFGVMLVSILK